MAIEQILVSRAVLGIAELTAINAAGKPFSLSAVTVAGARDDAALNAPPPVADVQYPANEIDHGRARRGAPLPPLNAWTEPR